MIYLDTHIVVWLYTGQVEKFTEQAKNLINENNLYISSIVRLELQYLFEIQKITTKADNILINLSNQIGLKTCDKNFNSIIGKALDFSWTRDPFDHLIVANAALNNDILVTKDQNILEHYKKAVW